MDTYIRELKKKSPEHKKRFALIVSGSVTLIIFVTWMFVKFGVSEPVVVNKGVRSVELASVTQADTSFFKDVFSAMGGALGSITEIISNGK